VKPVVRLKNNVSTNPIPHVYIGLGKSEVVAFACFFWDIKKLSLKICSRHYEKNIKSLQCIFCILSDLRAQFLILPFFRGYLMSNDEFIVQLAIQK